MLNTLGNYTPVEKRAITRALNILREKSPTFEPTYINNLQAAEQYCALHLTDASREQFLVLFLNTQNQLITSDILFKGTLARIDVSPREILKRVVELNAAAVILAHNHPSGEPTPSQADIDLTREIREALTVINVALLDHVVVGNGQGCPCVSLADRGLI